MKRKDKIPEPPRPEDDEEEDEEEEEDIEDEEEEEEEEPKAKKPTKEDEKITRQEVCDVIEGNLNRALQLLQILRN